MSKRWSKAPRQRSCTPGKQVNLCQRPPNTTMSTLVVMAGFCVTPGAGLLLTLPVKT
jgi:hypothetical protein